MKSEKCITYELYISLRSQKIPHQDCRLSLSIFQWDGENLQQFFSSYFLIWYNLLKKLNKKIN